MARRPKPPVQPVCEIDRVYCGIYRVRSLLGRGASAEVYLVHHEITRRDAALKVLRTSVRHHEQFVERFHGEGRALSEVRHQNLVEVFHVGVDAEIGPYIAMELLRGKTLEQILSRTRMSMALGIELLLQIASGLDALHAAGMIHRDVKPGNIFVPAGGEAKILDLGEAKIPKYDYRPTDLILVPGTGKYLSPEALASEEVTARSDLYALGVVAYEIFAGCHPALVDRVPDEEDERFAVNWNRAPIVKPLANFVPGLPEGLSEVVSQALARDPAARFATMGAFANALRSVTTRRAIAPTQALPTLRRVPLMTFEQALSLPTPLGAWSTDAMNLAAGEEPEEAAHDTLANPTQGLPTEPIDLEAYARRATIAVLEREGSRLQLPLREGEVILGRTGDVTIDDTSISTQHARLIVGEARTTIEDLDSTNGVRINGRRVRHGELAHGDVVMLGRVRLQFLKLEQPSTDDAASLAETETGPVPTLRKPAIDETVTDRPPVVHWIGPPPAPAVPRTLMERSQPSFPTSTPAFNISQPTPVAPAAPWPTPPPVRHAPARRAGWIWILGIAAIVSLGGSIAWLVFIGAP